MAKTEAHRGPSYSGSSSGTTPAHRGPSYGGVGSLPSKERGGNKKKKKKVYKRTTPRYGTQGYSSGLKKKNPDPTWT
jgi:hypothetical protein|tara:strand:+ start:1493 stop:1723 length:231 start_codon:yes stop_codon:yes gene_type:complete